jgi:hypothetical protein
VISTRAIGFLLSLSIAALAADKPGLKVQPANTYPNHQTNAGVTIAAVPYATQEVLKPLFGKANLLEFGVLPVLLVIQNGSGKAIKLETLEVDYVTPEQRKVRETPADDVRFLDSPKRPNFGGPKIPNPLPIPRGKPKSKLDVPEIEGHAFAARMLPPGDNAHGFVYFQTGHRRGSKLYIRGLVDAASGVEMMFFEVPLE